MPELPEVETVCQYLNKTIKNQKITRAIIHYPKLIKDILPSEFIKLIQDQKINSISRKGKHILIHLEEYTIISHLRMEGKYACEKLNNAYEPKHVLAEFYLTNHQVLRYYDSRRFGTIHLFKRNLVEDAPQLKKLGLEPFDEKLTVAYLQEAWKGRKNAKIKIALLSQDVITGIGNIYADEILFQSKLLPIRQIKTLEKKDFQNIINFSRQILTKAIEAGGTTVFSFSHGQNKSGTFQNQLFVYGRNRLPCFKCGSIICKIKLNGRGTHFCSNCQK